MKKWTSIFSMFCILLSISTFAFSDNPPSCGTLCGVCGILDIAWENIPSCVTIVESNILFPVWASCGGSTCCANDICQLSINQKNVSAGFWTCESGISLGIQIPSGYSIGAGGTVSMGGQTIITVEGGVKLQCFLTRCQKSNQEVGPYYHTVSRKVMCTRQCYNPTNWLQNNPCSWGQYVCSGPLIYYKRSNLWYLLVACKVEGTCGIPSSEGCSQCSDPYNPSCN